MTHTGRSPAPTDPFLITESRTWTYLDLDQLSRRWSAEMDKMLNETSAIARHGETIRPSSLLLLRSRHPETLLLHLACAWIARIPVLPIDPDMPAPQLELLSDQLPWSGALVDEPGATPGFGLLESGEAPVAPAHTIHAWAEESRSGSESDTPDPDSPDEEWALPSLRFLQEAWWGALLTSGTTGTPKVVPHKRRVWIHAVSSAMERTPVYPGESWLLPLPLHHAGGINVLLRALLTGSAIHLPKSSRPTDLANAFRTNPGLRAASMVPTQLTRLLGERSLDIPDPFHGILTGGGPIRTTLLESARQRKLPVIASYGMTETAGQIASALPGDGSEPWLQIHPPHEIQVVDEALHELPLGEDGLIRVRGPQLFEGYLSGRTLLRDRFDPDGWFLTGDWGRRNADDPRSVEILSRRTDLILSGGENIYPSRVEQILESFPEVAEALVIGMEDPDWGEKVIALIVPGGDPNRDDPSSIKRAIREQSEATLSPAERPKEILFIEGIPLTDNGKPDRMHAVQLAKEQVGPS